MKAVVVLADPEEHLLVQADLRDVTAFDMVGRKALGYPFTVTSQQIQDSNAVVFSSWIAWHAATRQGVFGGDFNAWVSRVASLEVEDTSDGQDSGLGLDPTSRAADPG